MFKRGLPHLLAIITLVLAASVQWAAGQSAPSQGATTHQSRNVSFPKDTNTYQIYGNYMADPTNSDVRWGGTNVGVSHYFADDVSLSLEACALYIPQQESDAWAGNLGGLLRQHVLSGDSMSLFVDVGVGVFQANTDVPEDGTRFNFLFRSGVGVTYRMSDHVYLIGGARLAHLSNARLWGSDRNPSLNGIECYAGLMFTF